VIVGLDRLDHFDLIYFIEEEKGESSLGNYTSYGLASLLYRFVNNKSISRKEINDIINFYNKNRLYFNLFYEKASDLKKNIDKYEYNN
jgi:hypothetical protein